MKTLVNSKIILQTSNKDGLYSIVVSLDKKDTNCLTIKAVSHNTKDKRIVGTITRYGVFHSKHTPRAKGLGKLVDAKFKQIETVLDLTFGQKRDKFPVIDKKGHVQFISTKTA